MFVTGQRTCFHDLRNKTYRLGLIDYFADECFFRVYRTLYSVTDFWKKNIGVAVRQEGGGAAGTNM